MGTGLCCACQQSVRLCFFSCTLAQLLGGAGVLTQRPISPLAVTCARTTARGRPGSPTHPLPPLSPPLRSDLRKNHGKEEARARDLFYALWIPDLFMERVEVC